MIGKQDIRLRYFEEAFTTEHWMVRIYRVLPPAAREPRLANALRPKEIPRPKRVARTPSGAAP